MGKRMPLTEVSPATAAASSVDLSGLHCSFSTRPSVLCKTKVVVGTKVETGQLFASASV